MVLVQATVMVLVSALALARVTGLAQGLVLDRALELGGGLCSAFKGRFRN